MTSSVLDLNDCVSQLIPAELDEKWMTPHWFALYARSRHEKFVGHELEKKGIQTFLPLRRIKRRWSDRTVTIEEPLFRGYIFVHCSLMYKRNALNTKGAVRFVGADHEPAIVTPGEIEALQRFVAEDIRIDPFPYLRIGERVSVVSGPFKGIEGFVVRKDGQCRLAISFDVILQSVTIEMDEACLAPL